MVRRLLVVVLLGFCIYADGKVSPKETRAIKNIIECINYKIK